MTQEKNETKRNETRIKYLGARQTPTDSKTLKGIEKKSPSKNKNKQTKFTYEHMKYHKNY